MNGLPDLSSVDRLVNRACFVHWRKGVERDEITPIIGTRELHCAPWPHIMRPGPSPTACPVLVLPSANSATRGDRERPAAWRVCFFFFFVFFIRQRSEVFGCRRDDLSAMASVSTLAQKGYMADGREPRSRFASRADPWR